jgi:hypothetical protein
MKPTYQKRNRWQVIIPASLTGSGKRQRRFFDTKEEADAEVTRWTQKRLMSEVLEGPPLVFLDVARSELTVMQSILDAIRQNKVTIIRARR